MKGFAIFILSVILFASTTIFGALYSAQKTMKEDIGDLLSSNELTAQIVEEVLPIKQLEEAGVPQEKITEITESKEFQEAASKLSEGALDFLASSSGQLPSDLSALTESVQKELNQAMDTSGYEIPQNVKDQVNEKVSEAMENGTLQNIYTKVASKIPSKALHAFTTLNDVLSDSVLYAVLGVMVVSLLLLALIVFHPAKWLLYGSIPVILSALILKVAKFLIPIVKHSFFSSQSELQAIVDPFFTAFSKRLGSISTLIMIIGFVMLILYFMVHMIYKQFHSDSDTEDWEDEEWAETY